MYIPFSDSKNIDKMVRQIEVFLEEETLEATIIPWKGSPYKNFEHWVKYVSSKSKNKREVFLYWDRKTEDIFLKNITLDLFKNKNYFKKLNDYFLNSYRNFRAITDKLYGYGPQFFIKQPNKKLVQLFKKFNYFNKYALAGYYVVYNLTNLFIRLVEKETKKAFLKSKNRNPEEIFKIISTIGINSLRKYERIAFLKKLKIIQKIYKNKRNWQDKKIQDNIFKQWYEFGPSRYVHKTNKTYSLKDYQNQFFKNIRVDSDVELKKIQKQENTDNQIVKSIFNIFKDYPDIIKHISWLRTMMGYRNFEADYYYSYFDHSLYLFDEINKRLKLAKNDNDIWFLSKQEIIDGLTDKIKVFKIVNERKKRGFTIKQIGRKISVFTGVKPEDWHEGKIKEHITSFKGMIAFKGIAKGLAKIIFNPSTEGKYFKINEILVTSMTTPEFVPLMKRAKAIITDEGGLLCHAAIIAREMEKPCIIGTKIATQVLKDGDLVEVDAEKGIVNILEKK